MYAIFVSLEWVEAFAYRKYDTNKRVIKMAKNSNSFKKNVYFPTLVFQMDIADADKVNSNLLNLIYAEQEKDQEGISRSNIKALGGWHSHNNLHKESKYSELVGHIHDASGRISEDLGYSKEHALAIGTMWSIINPPGAVNRAHVHPGCIWSGVYYIHAPEKAGNIEFVEPRTAHLMNQPKYLSGQTRKRDCWTKVNFTPRAGRMIIFPSWLYHAVNANLSEETGKDGNRVIVSFNLNQRKI